MEPSVEYVYTGTHVNDYFPHQYNPSCPSMLCGDNVRVTFDNEFDIITVDWEPRYALGKNLGTYYVRCSRSQWRDILAYFGGSLKETKRKVWNHEA